MSVRNLSTAVVVGLALASCQQILKLDEGTLSSSSSSSTSGSTFSTASSTSSGGAGGASTSSSTSGSGAAQSASSTSTSTSTSTGTGGAVNPANMIDDMEDGNAQIITLNGRSGSWFTYNDGSGTQTPTPPMCDPVDGGHDAASKKSMHTSGTGFDKGAFGAGLGFDLKHPGIDPRAPYDAHKFKGIVFWAKGTTQPVHIQMLEPATVPTTQPAGTCVPPDGGKPCGDSHQVDIVPTSTWTQYSVAFEDMVQQGWGVAAPFDPSQILTVQFLVSQSASFDLWIDDVGFYQ